MRNLQIEVRQVRGSSQRESELGAQGGIVLQPGNSRAIGSITAQSQQRNDTRDLVQRVLVLNGRPVNINLGNSTPVRLVQTFVQNGVVRHVSGTVLIDANSGFSARPVWRGGSSAELEVAAVQTSNPGAGLRPAPASRFQAPELPVLSSSSTSTALALPLDEWTTIAQSDDDASSRNRGLLGSTQSASSEQLRVEVRLSVR